MISILNLTLSVSYDTGKKYVRGTSSKLGLIFRAYHNFERSPDTQYITIRYKSEMLVRQL